MAMLADAVTDVVSDIPDATVDVSDTPGADGGDQLAPSAADSTVHFTGRPLRYCRKCRRPSQALPSHYCCKKCRDTPEGEIPSHGDWCTGNWIYIDDLPDVWEKALSGDPASAVPGARDVQPSGGAKRSLALAFDSVDGSWSVGRSACTFVR